MANLNVFTPLNYAHVYFHREREPRSKDLHLGIIVKRQYVVRQTDVENRE